jgi:hypothetical protein
MYLRFSSAIVLTLIIVLASGCLVSKGSTVRASGTKVSQPTLSQIEPGKTTESWLLAVAGEPSSRRKIDDHTSILRYEHSTTVRKGGSVFLLFRGHEEKTEKSAAVFEVTDGIITRYWTES